MDIRFNDNIHATNPIKFDFFIFVLPPVTHTNKIGTPSIKLFVAFGQDRVRIERLTKSSALV